MLSGTMHNLGIIFIINSFVTPPASNLYGICARSVVSVMSNSL